MRTLAAFLLVMLIAPSAGAADAPASANEKDKPKERERVRDSLKGKTVGKVNGKGEFEKAADGTIGWRSTGGQIEYDVGHAISDGYFECTMTGFTAPAAGADKSHPLSAWETVQKQHTHYTEKASFWNWRIGTGYKPFKVLAAGVPSKGGDSVRTEERAGDVDAVNDGKPHTYRVEWKDGVVQFMFDGKTISTQKLDRFAVRIFLIGKDDMYPATNPAPIIAAVRVVERAGK